VIFQENNIVSKQHFRHKTGVCGRSGIFKPSSTITARPVQQSSAAERYLLLSPAFHLISHHNSS
jgi:hypothetical protein